ncbi:DEAD/DEAH box helicase domain-containing protein, partial [Toxoplasma gondii CAST]
IRRIAAFAQHLPRGGSEGEIGRASSSSCSSPFFAVLLM